MTEALLESKLGNGSTVSSGELIGKLSTKEPMPFEELKNYIGRLDPKELSELIEDLIYTEEISLTKKAMSFKILYTEYARDLFKEEGIHGIHVLMMYYSKLSSGTHYIEGTKARVGEIMGNKKPTLYTKEYTEKILFKEPFSMGGSDIDKICETLGIN